MVYSTVLVKTCQTVSEPSRSGRDALTNHDHWGSGAGWELPYIGDVTCYLYDLSNTLDGLHTVLN